MNCPGVVFGADRPPGSICGAGRPGTATSGDSRAGTATSRGRGDKAVEPEGDALDGRQGDPEIKVVPGPVGPVGGVGQGVPAADGYCPAAARQAGSGSPA